MEPLTLRRFFLSLLTLTLVVLPGCSIGSFIGAYFNTYYNAQKAFNEAESEVLTAVQQQNVARTERPYLAPFDTPPQTRTKFATVIEKCSKLLQYHPESKLVDDALLMIGKSYFYQNDLQSAERKFKELLSTYPESDLVLEAKLLLAQTHYRSNDKTAAATVAMELFEEAKAQGEDGITAEAGRLIGHIHLENKNYEEALRYFQTAAELAETSDDRAAMYRRVAEMHMHLGNYAKAAEAFARSEDVGSSYMSKYRGLIGQARMLSKVGKHEESLALLEDMVRNMNFREFFGEINLEIGNVYRDEKDYRSAEEQYRYVDTAYARSEVAAHAYYQLGLLYEKHYGNYDSARVAYDKGRAEFPQAEITAEIVKRSELFNRYFLYRKEIERNDSLRRVILAPRDTSVAVAPDTTHRDSTGVAQGKTDSTARSLPSSPPPPMDTVLARLAYNTSELASLFYTGLQVIDSATYWYTRLITEHPKSRYVPRALYTLAQIARQDSTASPAYADSLLRIIVDQFPESEFATAARSALGLPVVARVDDSVEVAYRSAEQMMNNGDYTAALEAFRRIAERDTTSPLAAKAQYAIGWIYENVHFVPDSSVAHYRRLARRFPSSPYSAAVQPKLAALDAERQKNTPEAPKDTTNVAPLGKQLPGAPLKVVPAPEEMLQDTLMDESPKLRKKKE
jgi:TolA-binding protein